MKKFAIKTLGCKVNQYEEQVIRESLSRFGFIETEISGADVFIVNSCTVTAKADSKTRKLIRQAKKENPKVTVLVTGCYVVVEEDVKELLSLPEVDIVVPGSEKMKIALALESNFDFGNMKEKIREEVTYFEGHTRAFLKVQDGCGQRCSYCKVNIVRGPSRSRPKEEVLSEMERLTGRDYREIVLTGVCLGSWKGKKEENVADLLSELAKTEGDFRIRMSSIEPGHIDDKLIETIASSGKICSHLHIPLQSGSDDMLKRMNRNYGTREFHSLVRKLRSYIPDIGISLDVIMGHPGETEASFRETLAFLNDIKPSRLHVFSYSDRKGTASFEMKDRVPKDVTKHRVEETIQKGEALKGEFCERFLGREVEVLVEKRSEEGIFEGYTSEYLRTKIYGFEGSKGDIVKIEVDDLDEISSCLMAGKGVFA